MLNLNSLLMKRIIFITIIFALCNLFVSIAQDGYTLVTNVKTPNNSVVQDTYTLTSPDVYYTSDQLSSLASYLYTNYNGAEIIDVPSLKYNCHAYAWHVSEGGDKVWIGKKTDTAEDIYWTDGSYTEVPESIATKVSYDQSGNHSAIRINSEWYQSKWGPSALVKHHPNDVDTIYKPQKTKKFYIKKPLIVGVDLLYGTETYTFSRTPSNFTVQISPNLTLVSSTGNSVTVSPAYNGSTYINILLDGIPIAQKLLSVGPPIISGITYDGYALNAQIYGSSTSVIKTEWTIDYNIYSSAGAWIYSPVNTGTHTISVRAYNNLGWGSPFTTDFTFPGSSMYSINVNARNVSVALASTQLTGLNSRADASSVNNALSYSVIDLTTGVVAVTGKLPATGGAVDLNNLLSGIYVFRLDDGMGNVQSIKIILK